MINVVRRSQIIGLLALDGSTGLHLGETEEVWLDERGRVTYLSGGSRYLPLEQVFVVGSDAVLTYSSTLVDAPDPLLRLHRLAVESTLREPLGWVEDFLFDWQTGEIAAYILSGTIAGSSDNRVVLYPEDIETIETEAVVIREEAKNRLKTEVEGLKGFLSEKSQAVKNLVKIISDRLHGIVSPEDKSQAVRIATRAFPCALRRRGVARQN